MSARPFQLRSNVCRGPTRRSASSPIPTSRYRVVLLTSGADNSEAGYSLGAADLDGDGLLDLAIGMPALTFGNIRRGAVSVIPGSHLRGLPRQRFGDDPVAQPMDSDATWRVLGHQFGARFGHGLAAFRGHIVVSAPTYEWGEGGRGNGIGGAWIYEFGPDGPVAEPVVTVVGESFWPAGMFGNKVQAGPAGDGFAIAIATRQGAGLYPDSGSVYTWVFGD